MIAKRVPKKEGKKSSYRELANYILDRQVGDGSKVRSAWATNCAAPDDFDLCIAEVVATQDLNTRSKIDKTYHLVVSLAAGEDLTDEQWRETERRMCEAIGLGEHQRICSVHGDTDHVHMHIALSKVHRLQLTCTEPFYDKLKLQTVCRELEKEFGLKPGVGPEVKKRLAPAEVHQGLETFAGWIRSNLAPELSKVLSEPGVNWQQVQALAGRFGLEIREHGAGLVFSHLDKKLFVKASEISRSLSKKKLEDLLGKFEASNWKGKPENSYTIGPSQRTVKKDKLFAEFAAEKESWISGRNAALSMVSDVRYKRIQEIKERYAKRRLEVKRDTMIAKGRKRSIYQKLSQEMQKELSEVFADTKSRRTELRSLSKSVPWRDWVYERAVNGDETALEVLRSKLPRTEEFGLGALVGQERNHIFISGLSRTVHHDGSIEYQVGGGSFIDKGDAIVLRSVNDDTVKAALLAARVKFGRSFDPKGPDSFMQLAGSYSEEREGDQTIDRKAPSRSARSGPDL